MKKLRKLIVGGVLGLLALVAVGLFVVVMLAGSLARRGIEAGATYALGVRTTLASARVGLFSGKFGMSDLNVASPQGFPAPHFLTLGDAAVAVSLTSLTKDTIVVPTFSLDAIDVHLEKKEGKANYQVILDNLKKLSGPPDPSKPQPGDEGKRLIINELTITDVTVHVDVAAFAANPAVQVAGPGKIDVPVKEIKLRNVGRTGEGVGGTGVTIGELSSIIVQAVLAAVVENAGDQLPGDLLKDLTGQLAQLDGLVNIGVEIGGKAVNIAETIGQEAGQAVQGAAKEAEKAVEGIGRELEGILGGGKKKPGGG